MLGISLSIFASNNNIIENATYAKFVTEIKTLEEQIQLKQLMSDENYSGTVNEILEINSNYNDLLYIEDGKIVYISSKTSLKEKKWLQGLGIEAMSDYFVVDFESSGGTEVPAQKIKSGNKVTKPENPVKNGYEFAGWYYLKTIGSGDNATYEEKEFDFNTEILENYTLYAKYVGEAVMITRNNNVAFWQAEYREKITNISFEKVNTIEVPENVESWEVNQDGTSEIIAYVVDDNNGGLVLHVVSKYEIYAPGYLARYFNDFPNLTTIDFQNFKTDRVGNMFHLFEGDIKLKQLNIELLSTKMVNNTANMFFNCNSLEKLNLYNFDTENVTQMDRMFQQCNSLKSLDVSSFNTDNLRNAEAMFRRCSSLESLDLDTFNTEKITSMQYMFEGDTNLKKLNLSNFNTSNVTKMNSMFQGCSSLETLDLKSFDTSNVTNMQDMFTQTGIKNLDISNFNTEKVTTMYRMFRDSESLESVNLNNFNNNSLTTVEAMFMNCTSLQNVMLQNFNTGKVTSMSNMFSGCSSLQEVDLRSFDTSNVDRTVSMFYKCENITEIKVNSKWDLTKANTANMFLLCGVKGVTVYE